MTMQQGASLRNFCNCASSRSNSVSRCLAPKVIELTGLSSLHTYVSVASLPSRLNRATEK